MYQDQLKDDQRFRFLAQYSELESLGKSDGSSTTLSLWTPSIFDRDTFAWVGGSLFGAIKGNLIRYIMREEYLSFQHREQNEEFVSSPSSFSVLSSSMQVHSRVPDWMSLNPHDWRFYGTTNISVAPTQTVKSAPPKGPWTILKTKQKLKSSSHPTTKP